MRKRTRSNNRSTDIPPPEKKDIVTISTRIPRVTEYTVVRGLQQNILVASATISSPTYYFNLYNSNVGNSHFDLYRIAAIRFNIRSQQNAIGLTTNSTTTLNSLYCVIDYDDDAALSNVNAAQGYANCLVLPPGQSCSRTFRPHVAVPAYAGSSTSFGYTNVPSPWIDAASDTVRHYGVKLVIPASTPGQTQNQTWDVSVEYFIEFKKSI